MIRAFVDRVETSERGEPLAVLLIALGEGDYLHWHCPLAWLPPDTREGSWLQVAFTPDEQAQAEMRHEIESLLQELQGE